MAPATLYWGVGEKSSHFNMIWYLELLPGNSNEFFVIFIAKAVKLI